MNACFQKPFVPTKSNYRDKYQHLIGDAKDKIGQVNKSFGFVSAEEKKDRRTMEQIQADIRAKRKMAGLVNNSILFCRSLYFIRNDHS